MFLYTKREREGRRDKSMKGIREKEISRELTLCIGRGKAIFPFLLNSNSIY